MTRPIVERMAEAKQAMRFGRRIRTPRVFFLSAADYADFMATEPPMMDYATHSRGSPVILEVPAFDGTAVRQSQAKNPVSTLYSWAGTTRMVRAK
jgi:hypothetical protein